MPNPVAGSVVVELYGEVYVIGGSNGSVSTNEVQVYDLAKGTWSTKKSMPTARAGAAYAVVNNKIYVFGGYTGNYYTFTGGTVVDNVEVYDPVADTWEIKKHMPLKLMTPGASDYNGKIYLFGGLEAGVNSVSNVQEYNPITDTWVSKNDMKQIIHSPATITYKNKIYLIGGRKGSSSTFNTLKVYDPETDTWETKANMNFARGGGVGAAILEGKIYAIGGVSPTAETNTVEAYDPLTNTWEIKPNLNDARFGTSAVTYKGQIFVIGGSSKTASNTTVGSVEVYPEKPNSSEPDTATPGNRAILVVTMDTGLEKEFDLSMEEVNAFISWYENKQSGSGSASYAINKHDNNKGPFSSRKDYMIFNKILTYQVSEY
ncbi:MAG: kelch repeat-containing protein [Paenibacillus polymyxa]|nr:kelch repeat-containing protein [Paenibacillus polymyxa]